MALGNQAVIYPGPVTVYDETPKKGYITIHLGVPQLEVKKAFMKDAEPKNGSINHVFKTGSIEFDIKITSKEGKEFHYMYQKNLPEDISPDWSSYKVEKGRVILKLCKAESNCWAQHAKFFIKDDKKKGEV